MFFTLEGNLNVVDIDDRDSEVSKEEKCINEFVWNKINKSIDKVVDNITLLTSKGFETFLL